MKDMSTDHEAYHVDFEGDEEGQVPVLAPNPECPYCLDQETPETLEQTYEALRFLIEDVATGPGGVWPAPRPREFRNLARALVWRALDANQDPKIRERVLALGRGE